MIPMVPTDPYSRIRGGLIVRRGNWSHNSTFGRCLFCQALTIHGRCIACHEAVACAECGRVRTTHAFVPDPEPLRIEQATHTICPDCMGILYPEQWPGMIARRQQIAEAHEWARTH